MTVREAKPVILSQAVRAQAAEDVVVGVVLWGELDVTSVPSLSRHLGRRILVDAV